MHLWLRFMLSVYAVLPFSGVGFLFVFLFVKTLESCAPSRCILNPWFRQKVSLECWSLRAFGILHTGGLGIVCVSILLNSFLGYVRPRILEPLYID